MGSRAVKAIHKAVEDLFTRAKVRWLGREHGPKVMAFTAKPVGHREDLSLGGVFDASSRSEGFQPNEDLRASLNRIAEGYLDAHCELAKVRTVHAVQAWLHDADAQGIETKPSTVLAGELAELMGQVTTDLKRLVETETTRATNVGTLDGIIKVNALAGIADPMVYFVVVRDANLCSECRRLHLRPDGKPRVYLMSEVGNAYHKRGDETPKVGGLHPHCRCTMVALMPGYGFDSAGKVTYVGQDHNELESQRNK